MRVGTVIRGAGLCALVVLAWVGGGAVAAQEPAAPPEVVPLPPEEYVRGRALEIVQDGQPISEGLW